MLAAAVDTLAPAQRGQMGRWPMAWSGSDGFSSPAEELILSMQSPHAQVKLWQGIKASACRCCLLGLEDDTAASKAAPYHESGSMSFKKLIIFIQVHVRALGNSLPTPARVLDFTPLHSMMSPKVGFPR